MASRAHLCRLGPMRPILCEPTQPRGAYLGLDTVAFRGSLDTVLVDRLERLERVESTETVDWRTGEIGIDRFIYLLPSGGRFRITCQPGHPTFGTVEASLPKVATGSNFDPLPSVDALVVMRALYDEVGERARWKQSFLDQQLMRADATGHFTDVTQRDRLLTALAFLPVPLLPPTSLRHDTGRGGALTLSRGPGRRWKMVTYDKEAEVAARATRAQGEKRAAAARDLARSRGVLRCELVLRRPVLRELCMDTVGQLDDSVLSVEHRRRFHQVGLGLSVAGMDTIARKASMATDMTPQARAIMLAVLLYDFLGEESGLKDDVVRKYRKCARELGFAAESITDGGIPVRLDYDLARQVEVHSP